MWMNGVMSNEEFNSELKRACRGEKTMTEIENDRLNNNRLTVNDIEQFCNYCRIYKFIKVSDSLKQYIVDLLNSKDVTDNLANIVKRNIKRNIPQEENGYNFDDYDFCYKYLTKEFDAFKYTMDIEDDVNKRDYDKVSKIVHESKNGNNKSKANEVKEYINCGVAALGLVTACVTTYTLLKNTFGK